APVSPGIVDPAVLEILPREYLEEQTILPMFLVSGRLTLAVAEPSNVFLIEEVEKRTDYEVQPVASTSHHIRATLHAMQPDGNVFVIDDLVPDIKEDELRVVDRQIADLTDIEKSASESPVIKLVNYLICSAVQDRASDLHIEPDDNDLRVRFRVDGKLFEKMKPPLQMLPAMVSRVKIMAGLDISERRMPQDGGISVMIDKRQIDLRVSTMPGKFGEKVVIRVIDKNNAVTKLENLGFGEAMIEQWRRLVAQPNGIVLVTGPTGSGKSSTLYATLNEINRETVNISTVEDPVEFNLPGVNQFQVNERAGFSFAGALRSLLRQDPDVIMVGEIRDPETARIATQAALTGHMVFSTLHTNDSASAVTRLFNIGVEPYLVAASLRGVLAQRLVRRICDDCKRTVPVTDSQHISLQRMGKAGRAIDHLFAGTGCSACRETGVKGRIGVYELLVPSDEALDAVSRGASLQELRTIARKDGFTSLRDDGLVKVRDGVITLEELMTATAM
ncbi:MAG: GspE/PulE family protein, partial [Rhodospirillales bacterium]|nr:GspE/PulE family protein [Rhodospirillales bacterium]